MIEQKKALSYNVADKIADVNISYEEDPHKSGRCIRHHADDAVIF